MPKLDGFKTTAKIRMGEWNVRNPKIPIVAMTAHAMEGDREACIAAGMDDYLHKPVRIDDVHNVLLQWIPSKISKKPSTPVEPAVQVTQCSVDFTVLDRLKKFRRKGGTDPITEMIDIYIRETIEDLSKLKESLQDGNTERFINLIHGLKSSSANVGATAMSELSRTIEEHARHNEMKGQIIWLDQLETEYHKVRKSLLSYKESDSPD